MVKSKEFTKNLDKNGQDRLRIKIKVDTGVLVDIVVQYETLVAEKWLAVVRYDMSHGFFHRDVLNLKAEKIKNAIEIDNLKSALLFAEQDLKDKWEFYKGKFLKPLKDDKSRKRK